MSVRQELQRLEDAKQDIKDAIEATGVEVPSSALLSTYANYINAIPVIKDVKDGDTSVVDSNRIAQIGGKLSKGVVNTTTTTTTIKCSLANGLSIQRSGSTGGAFIDFIPVNGDKN